MSRIVILGSCYNKSISTFLGGTQHLWIDEPRFAGYFNFIRKKALSGLHKAGYKICLVGPA